MVNLDFLSYFNIYNSSKISIPNQGAGKAAIVKQLKADYLKPSGERLPAARVGRPVWLCDGAATAEL